MPIPQLARNPSADENELLSHAFAIGATIQLVEDATDYLLSMTLATYCIGLHLLQNLEAIRDEGVEHIVPRNGPEYNVRLAIAALHSSSDVLLGIAHDLNSHFLAYERQLNAHHHLLSASLGGAPLQPRVICCQQQATILMNQQKIDLQSHMHAIEYAEGVVVGLHNLMGDDSATLQVHPAIRHFGSFL